jgi:hypothetical protein
MSANRAETTSPVELVGHWLQNLMDPGVVHRVVAF